jgi:hypothetical protein
MHMSWCDPDQHSDGRAYADPDPGEQVCCSDLRLDFGLSHPSGRRRPGARLGLTHMHPHPDSRDERSETTLTVSVDGWDGLLLWEEQIEPIAYGMLERLAMLRGRDESAEHWRRMALTAASPESRG